VDDYGLDFRYHLSHDPSGAELVRAGMGRLSATEFPLERTMLLMAYASNPANAESARQFALDELTQSPPPARPDPHAPGLTETQLDEALSTTPAQIRPIAAESILLRSSRDPAQALAGTVEGVAAQSDVGIRTKLVMQFLDKYPDQRDGLQAALEARGVSLKFVAQGGE
jgi:hypothetical protein